MEGAGQIPTAEAAVIPPTDPLLAPRLSAGQLAELRRNRAVRPYLLETSLPGVFAAGDVRSGSVKRVASAVGEGSIAVRFVSEYLGRRSGFAAAAAAESSPGNATARSE
jgi:NADPH-dependent glutamate synthase beta subunit-like oxidoreductase